ncbi:hypothetical protein [Spirosoma gilvum]
MPALNRHTQKGQQKRQHVKVVVGFVGLSNELTKPTPPTDDPP